MIIVNWTLKVKGEVTLLGPLNDIVDHITNELTNPLIRFDNENRYIHVIEHGENRSKSEIMKEAMHKYHDQKAKKYGTYIDDPDYKFCWTCKRSKHLDNFGYRANSADKKSSRCKRCVNKRAKLNRERKKDQTGD